MTERLRRGSYAYAQAAKVRGPDLGPRKTMLVLVIVVGCFAVLWPKVFYPMLIGSAQQHIKPSPIDRTTGCCDVISETDVNTIRIMTELCRTVILKDEENAPLLTNKELIAQCQKTVLDTCGIDISAVLQEQVRLGQNTKQILNEIRSLNGSLCLKYNFGVSPGTLGVPHRVTVKVSPSSIKQERPPHLRSEMIHPAFRERGRAIPQTQTSSPSRPPPKIVEGRPGPIPGMRPTMGGAGHVVPSKQTTSTMGLVMPVYTIGIVIFFTYTVMKILFKKQPEALYPPIDPDPIFRREVFEANRGHLDSKLSRGASNKLVVNAMSALLDEVDQELAARRKASESTEQDVLANGKLHTQDDQTSVKVMGMEMRASCEGNQKWSHADPPVLPTTHQLQPQSAEPPHEIYLEGALPPQSNHLLVADSATEAQKISTEDDPAVVLAGKMTLSVISLDSSENGTNESAPSKKIENGSSSNVSDDFEKIELDEQIIDIAQEVQNIVTDENDSKEINDSINSESEDTSVETVQDQLEGFNQHILSEIDKELNNLKNESNELQVPEEKAVIIEKVQETRANQDLIIDPTLDLKLPELVNFTNEAIPSIQDTNKFLQTEKYKTEEIELDQNLKETVVESKLLNEKELQTERFKTEEVKPVQKLNEELQEDKTETVESRIPNEGLADTVNKFETVGIKKDSTANLNEASEEKVAATISNEKLSHSNELQDTPKVDSEVLEQLELKSETTSDDQQIIKDSIKSNDKDLTEHKTESNIGFESTKRAEVVEKFDKAEEAPSEKTSVEDEIMKTAYEGLNLAVSVLSTELNPNKTETAVSSGKIQEDVPLRQDIVDQNPDLNEVIDDDEEEVEYEFEYEEESENENIDDEIRNLDRINNLVNEEPVGRINGGDHETSTTMLTEHDISDGDNLINDEAEVEEVIEYITDEEETGDELETNNVNHIDRDAAHAN